MTHTQVVDLAEWIEDRWPHNPWSDREIEAFANDAGDLPFDVAYEAVQKLMAQGRQYAPKVSEVYALARQLNRHRPEEPKALPSPKGWNFGQSKWLDAHGFTSMDEAVDAYANGDNRCTGITSCPRCAVAAGSIPQSNQGYRPPRGDCVHGYWAIWEELDDGSRVGKCPVCRVERHFVKGQLMTRAEVG